MAHSDSLRVARMPHFPHLHTVGHTATAIVPFSISICAKQQSRQSALALNELGCYPTYSDRQSLAAAEQAAVTNKTPLPHIKPHQVRCVVGS